MRRRAPRASFLIATMLIVAALVPTGTAHAGKGGPGVWTKIGTTDTGFATVGMFRTADGKLHLVWRKRLQNHNEAYDYSTVALNGTLLNSGVALSNWEGLEEDPYLVHDGSGMRLVFKGSVDTSGTFFSRGSVYTMTSTNGTSWILVNGSLMQHTVLNGTFSATAELDDTPVAVAGLNASLFYHEGVDPDAPATAPDKDVTLSSGDPFNQTVATAKDGSVWLAWFRSFAGSKDGYYVQQILPTKGTVMKAPSSGNASQDNEPHQPVAFAARAGGGLYMAYCSPTSTKPCAHVDLWKVGASTPMIVPGSGNGFAAHVAIAAGLQGRMSVVWVDKGKNVIHADRTNTTVTAFGLERTIKLPPGSFFVNTLQAEGTFGRLDVIANATMTASPNPTVFWQTQILPGLALTANPVKFSHTAAHTVTFTVKDAGQPVQGAKVSCLGKSATTNSSGVAKITFPKGTAVGKHVATASATNYNPGKVTITVT
jgi:hypothetical protein